MSKYIIILFTFFSLTTFFACEKEKETKTEYITLTNTIHTQDTIINTDTLITIIRDTIHSTDTINNFFRDTATTIILVRHAETSGLSSNRSLSGAGQTRANNLSAILASVNLNNIYSTNYNRTKQTAQPTAINQSLNVILYNPSTLSSFIDQVLDSNHSKVALIVGHSNTTPDLLNLLVGSNVYNDLPETEYDNIFIVSVFERGRAEVLNLKY